MNSTMETYHGHVRTPADAIILFEACRLGLLPRVQRRLSEKERQGIKSGSVFVWDEQEAGMRRWTDGKSWSASRVSGSFLTYREMEGKRGGGSTFAPPVQSVSQRKSPNGDSDSDHLDPDGPDGYRYKPDGLVKQSFSITTSNGQKLHLISYYSRAQPHSMQLLQPTLDSRLKDIRPPKGMYPESTVHEQQNVPVMAAATSAQQPRQQVPTTLPPYQPHPNAIPQQPTYRTQGAPHPHSYAPPPHMHGAPYGHPHQQQQWLPSPTVTPPISMAGPMHSHYPTQLPVHGQYPPQLPPPIASQNSAMHYALQGTPLPVFDRSNDGSPQMPPVHRGQMPSPIMHLRNHDAHQQGYSGSPASGAHPSIANTPPRSNDGFEINPIRGSPDMRLPPQAQQLPPPQHIQPHLPGDVSPASRILDVQDIPAGRITSNEEMRMLRMLDKAFVA